MKARERLKNDAYQWALTLLDHQIAMGRVNVDQEIARLEEIKRAHELSTEELYPDRGAPVQPAPEPVTGARSPGQDHL